MSQLATIFEKIKEDFFENHISNQEKGEYTLIFSPFSTGFSYDDFLFLDSNMASENAHKYMDELLEFSQIANTIPRQENYWAVSDHNDYLFRPYKSILSSLRLMDVETLKASMLYEHEIFRLALSALNEDLRDSYMPFYELVSKLRNEISELETTLTEANRNTVDLEIQLKRDNLNEVLKKWLVEGKKEETEAKLVEIIKDEFKRFMKRFVEVKGRMETLARHHAGSGSTFYLTSCTPNNLFKSEGLQWKNIRLGKSEIKKLVQNLDANKYDAIIGKSDVSGLEVETISFELLFVNITRAWFDESILKSPFWDINILNRDEIDIPRITSKLVFVRNVDIALPRHSNKNSALLQQEVIKNLGPFILNTKNLKAGQNLQLHSVNKSLQVDRKTVLNVGSKLQKKQKSNRDTKGIIAKKQLQFVKLAPKLKVASKPIRPKTAQTKRASFSKFNPVLLKSQPFIKMTALLNFTKCKFHFFDRANQQPVKVQNNHILIVSNRNNKPVKAKLSAEAKHTLVTNLSTNGHYKLLVKVPGYITQEHLFKASVNSKTKVFVQNIWLEEEVDEFDSNEAFQLIGVISKEISAFPSPISGADYI